MGGSAAAGLELELPYVAPLSFSHLLRFLADRAVAGIEEVDGGSLTRSVRLDAGPPVVVELRPEPSVAVVVALVHEAPDGGDAAARVSHRVGTLLDLGSDPAPIDTVLGADPLLGPLVRAAPGLRVPGAADGFELAVRAIVGQQVSVRGARTTLARIAARFGDPVERPFRSVTHAFPTPERLADASDEDLRMPSVRAGAIRSVARMVSDGELDLDDPSGRSAAIERLRSIRGVGSWTVSYIAMRALRDPDAFPEGDLGIRRRVAEAGVADDARSIRERAEAWRPWRSYAAMHLWQTDQA